MEKPTRALIMAAGKGTRMKSSLPKMLHVVNGEAMISHVVSTVTAIDPRPVVVVGYAKERIMKYLGNRAEFAHQKILDGSGSAVHAGLTKISPQTCDDVLVLSGDKPFVTTETLQAIICARRKNDALVSLGYVDLTSASAEFHDMYSGTGRVFFDTRGHIKKIIEKRDATENERKQPTRNISFYCFKMTWLADHIDKLDATNAQKEFQIVDLIEKAATERADGVVGVEVQAHEGTGINTQEELQQAEKNLHQKTSR